MGGIVRTCAETLEILWDQSFLMECGFLDPLPVDEAERHRAHPPLAGQTCLQEFRREWNEYQALRSSEQAIGVYKERLRRNIKRDSLLDTLVETFFRHVACSEHLAQACAAASIRSTVVACLSTVGVASDAIAASHGHAVAELCWQFSDCRGPDERGKERGTNEDEQENEDA
eukprot:4765957-Amphidinium_carterae.4